MAAICIRILDGELIQDKHAASAVEAIDFGDFDELELVIRVTAAGVAADGAPAAVTLVLQHAPTADADALLDFPTAISVDLTTAGSTWIHVPYFTRWIFWFTTGQLASGATVTVDIVARH